MKDKELPPDPLIRTFDNIAPRNLSDEFLAIAHNIEMALQETGAQPEKDYTYLDLFKLAQPFVLELFKEKEQGRLEYYYPAHHKVK